MKQPTVVTGTAVVTAITREDAALKTIPVAPKPAPRIPGPKPPPPGLGSWTATRDIIAARERATFQMAAGAADAAKMPAPEILFAGMGTPSTLSANDGARSEWGPPPPRPPESESSLSGEFEDWNMLRDLPQTAPPESGSSFSGEAEEWDGTRDWPPSPSSKPRDSGSTEQVAAEGLDVGAADAGVERTVWRCSGREFVREWRSTSVAPMNGRGKSDGPGTDTMMRAPTYNERGAFEAPNSSSSGSAVAETNKTRRWRQKASCRGG